MGMKIVMELFSSETNEHAAPERRRGSIRLAEKLEERGSGTP
jgi:hypothetical protein